MSRQRTISAGQRNSLYETILIRLTNIDEVFLAIEAQEFDKAKRLSREYSDYLRILHDDLGWGETSSRQFRLSAPPEVWRRALSALRQGAAEKADEDARECSEVAEQEKRSRLLRDTCDELLGRLS